MIGPLFLGIAKLFSPFYSLVFGPLDRYLANKYRRSLEADVRGSASFLFYEFGGRVVPNRGVHLYTGFDFAYVTIAVEGVLICFQRGRGEIRVQVASESVAQEWHDLELIVSILDDRQEAWRGGYRKLNDACDLLQTYLPRIQAAFTNSLDGHIRGRLAQAYADEKVAIRQAEWEINKRFKQ